MNCKYTIQRLLAEKYLNSYQIATTHTNVNLLTLIETFSMENDASHQFKLIKSSRGGQKLAEGGYIYDKQKIYGEITHWQCEKKGECKARLHTKGMTIVKRSNLEQLQHSFHRFMQSILFVVDQIPWKMDTCYRAYLSCSLIRGKQSI